MFDIYRSSLLNSINNSAPVIWKMCKMRQKYRQCEWTRKVKRERFLSEDIPLYRRCTFIVVRNEIDEIQNKTRVFL